MAKETRLQMLVERVKDAAARKIKKDASPYRIEVEKINKAIEKIRIHQIESFNTKFKNFCKRCGVEIRRMPSVGNRSDHVLLQEDKKIQPLKKKIDAYNIQIGEIMQMYHDESRAIVDALLLNGITDETVSSCEKFISE